MTIHSFLQSDTPKRSRTPFVATGQTAYIVVIQSYAHNFRAHVMKQEVRVWMNCLTTQPRKAGSVQQYRTTWFCVQGGYMAEMALRLIKILLTLDHLFIIHIATCRNTKALHVEVYILHLFCRYIQLGIRKSHHTALIYLCLSFTDFFGIAAVRNSHIAGETKFHCQVGMLCFITGQA